MRGVAHGRDASLDFGKNFTHTRLVNGGQLSDSKGVNVPATAAYTSSGYSAPRMATARRLALVWGVHSVLCPELMDVLEMTDIANQAVLREGFGEAGQSIVISAGLPFNEPGNTKDFHPSFQGQTSADYGNHRAPVIRATDCAPEPGLAMPDWPTRELG